MRYWFWLLCVTQLAAEVRLVPHVAGTNGAFETRVQLINTGEQPADYRFTALRSDGSTIGVTQATLAGGLTLDEEAAAFFGSAEISHFTIDADDGIRVLVSYQAKTGGSPAQVDEQSTQAPRWQLFPGDWSRVHDGLALVNTGEAATDVHLRRVTTAGEVLEERVLFSQLGVMNKALHLLSGETAPQAGELFQIEADQPLALVAIRFNRDGSNFLWENPAVAMPATPQDAPAAVRTFKVLFTNDEHGWMEPTDDHGGAAGMAGLWHANEGPREDLLILSGGDMWTGPAISTWTKGTSMAAVLNAMDYDVAAVGNHEFDWGLDVLRERAAASNFPFVSANLRESDSGQRVDYALPFTIKRVGGINVGVIGLTTTQTPSITFPSVTGGIDFIDYEDALRETVPLVKAHGAEVVVVTAHTCTVNLRPVAPVAAELGIAMLAGGHCNHLRTETVSGVLLLESGSFLRYYGRVGFSLQNGQVSITDADLVENTGGTPDADVQAVVDYWAAEVADDLDEVIGYLEQPLARNAPALANMITDAWLWAFPGTDVGLSNYGGIRQGLPAGNITRADLVGVLPFDNYLYQLELTGEQVIDAVECCPATLGGLSAFDGYRLSNGDYLNGSQIYNVLTTDFLYEGGGNFPFASQDTTPFDTGMHWRDPVIEWILSLQTSAQNPLDPFLDTVARR